MFYYEKPGEMGGDHDGSVEGCELTSSHTYNKKYMYMWNNSQSTDRKMTEEIIPQRLQDRPWYNQVGWRKKGEGEGAEWMGRSCEGGNVPSPAYPLHWLLGVILDRQRAPESWGESLGAGLWFNRVKRDQHKGALRDHCTAHLGTHLLVCTEFWCWNLQFRRQTHSEDWDWLYRVRPTSDLPSQAGRPDVPKQPEEVNSKWQMFSPSLQKIKAASFSFVLTIPGSAWT